MSLLLAAIFAVFLAAANADDAATLLAFKASLSAAPSSPLSTWDTARSSHCRWAGVSCDVASSRVVALNLSATAAAGRPISGRLPEFIANLTQLRVLSLRYNAFSGVLPASIVRLRRLEVLDLSNNNFSGGIPVGLARLTSLRIVLLSYNSFDGRFPSSLLGLPAVRAIDVTHNQLTGAIAFDRRSACAFLVHLGLSSNLVSGPIPPEIGNCSKLRRLLLGENVLGDEIPVEIGRLSELRVMDVSRNSLVGRIPKEIGSCKQLRALVLTNLDHPHHNSTVLRLEFNSFYGGIPWEIFAIPSLEILWAPTANLDGLLPEKWSSSCQFRVINLAQNYRIVGRIPDELSMCRNLTFLDLSSNSFEGRLPPSLRVTCMVYLNVSMNFLSGSLPEFAGNGECDDMWNIIVEKDDYWDGVYLTGLVNAAWADSLFFSLFDEKFDVIHDYSSNRFVGSFPSFSFGDGFVGMNKKVSYGLLLNNNRFNGSLLDYNFLDCDAVKNVAVNLSANLIQGKLPTGPLFSCLKLSGFEAADNLLVGSIVLNVSDLQMLSHLDLRGNKLSGSIPDSLGGLKSLKWVFLGRNFLTGEIPPQLGQMTSLVAMDLSSNNLTGHIPPSLANAPNLESLLLNNNELSGEIPSSFANLTKLVKLDVSFNNLSGSVPHLALINMCNYFQGNLFLQPCISSFASSPDGLLGPVNVSEWALAGHRDELKPITIAMVLLASLILLALVVLVSFYVYRRRKFAREGGLKKYFVVTFADVPEQVNYENVLRSTEQFSIKYLIGTGGFGSTYKAELAPGYMVAVKRLSVGKIQGLRQFDAEIQTLGRIRHRNLVTLLGYYTGTTETFLIYNYLCGGNLDTFIHDRSYNNTKWSTIHKIAVDVAQALANLHDLCVPRIVHRDIKPSNILLDENLNAYISDFGLARLLEVSQTHATTDVIGTFGYVAPEYATTCRVTDKSDVYSFGVVLLELMSGKRSFDSAFSNYGHGFNIVSWANMLIQEARFSELIHSELWEAGPKEKYVRMSKLASNCTAESLRIRPPMRIVVEKLKQLKGW